MAKKFKYDIYSLIELVESKECLWDKTKEVAKDKILRKNAWHDICVFIEPTFEEMDQKMKDEITTSVMSKWSYIRDTFIKSLKTKSGQATKKKYIYSDQLQFLLKTVTPDETDSSVPTQNASENHPESPQSHLDESIPSPAISTSTKSTSSTRTKRLNPVDAEILKAIQATPAQPELIDEDHAFLMSLLPTVKQLDDDDKFEFKIEAMQLLRRLKRRRRLSSSLSIASSRDDGPQQQTPLISPQRETPQPSLLQPIHHISPQQGTTQFSYQQDTPVVINSITELISQDFSQF